VNETDVETVLVRVANVMSGGPSPDKSSWVPILDEWTNVLANVGVSVKVLGDALIQAGDRFPSVRQMAETARSVGRVEHASFGCAACRWDGWVDGPTVERLFEDRPKGRKPVPPVPVVYTSVLPCPECRTVDV
jgi:hypothetical protein